MSAVTPLTQLLLDHRILICVGSGGVGKTTLSASLAVRAAQMGRKVLVMTIDPSMRLRVALGLGSGNFLQAKVPGQNYKGELSAQLLNAEEIFRQFILQSTDRKDLAERLLKNRLYQQLSTTLSGSQEFTSLLQLTKIASEGGYDNVILDTPPAQHAIDFLEAPAKIEALFQDNVVRWFIGEEGEVGFIRKMISRGTQTVLGALEKITGSRFMSELNDFFKSVRSVQAKINQRTQQVQQILFSPETAFLLVTGFDVAKLKEAGDLKKYLDRQGYKLKTMVINRAFPYWSRTTLSPMSGELASVYNDWQQYHREREAAYINFAQEWSKILPVVRIPDLNKELNGLDGLEVMANELESAFSDSAADSGL